MTFQGLKRVLSTLVVTTAVAASSVVSASPMPNNTSKALPYELVETGELITLIKDYNLKEDMDFDVESGYAIGRITDLTPYGKNTYFYTGGSDGEPVFAGVIRGLNINVQMNANAYLLTTRKENSPFDFKDGHRVYLCVAHTIPVKRCHPLLK
jgi:hypothetical protein